MNRISSRSRTQKTASSSRTTRFFSGRSGLFLTLMIVCFLVLTTALSLRADTQPVRLLLVVNDETPIHSLSIEDLSDIFLKKKSTLQGQRLKPLNLQTDHPIRQIFDRKVHGKSTRQIEQYWLERKVKAESPEPRTLTRPFVVPFMIKQFKKGIGYVPLKTWKQLTDEQKQSLRVLSLRIPSSPEPVSYPSARYPLRGVISP